MLKPGPEPPGTPRPLPLAAPAPCWSDDTGTLFVLSMESFTADSRGSLQQLAFLDLLL